MIKNYRVEINTKGENDIHNITGIIQEKLDESRSVNGSVLIFLQSTTSGLAIVEYEEGLLQDLRNTMERLAPRNGEYEHEKAWHDGNGHSHQRSILMGVSITVPFADGKLQLGQWQQLILMEFDVRQRKRSVILQISCG